MDKQQMVEQEFRRADSNGDGFLTIDEARGRLPAIEHEFRRFDTDGDGRISLEEFRELRRLPGKPPPFKKKM